METYLIAEMAWSHHGSLERALEILNGAAQARAHAISIHITDMPSYMVENYRCLDGRTLSDSSDESQSIYSYLESINLTNDEWLKFGKRCEDLGIDLVVMCNDLNSFVFSKMLSVRHYVISAASFLERDLIREIVHHNPDIILRTGGATLSEIRAVVEFIFKIEPSAKICLLAGIQLYPTPIEELHIASLRSLAEQFDNYRVTIGLADHISGDYPFAMYLPALSLAYGARMIEKHITTDRRQQLEDYEAALNIDEFPIFVEYIRQAERALGDGSLDYMKDNDAYRKYRLVCRKRIVAAKSLPAGRVITIDDLTFKRSDHGAQMEELDRILGKKLKTSKGKDVGIGVEDVYDE